MPDEPTDLVQKVWRASLRFFGACLALWLGVKLLLQIWWVLAIIAVIIAAVIALIRWQQWRSW